LFYQSVVAELALCIADAFLCIIIQFVEPTPTDCRKVIAWRLTADHATTGYQYFMTRSGWNANAPLTPCAIKLRPNLLGQWRRKPPAYEWCVL
jgi:hypothetical protein